MDREWEQRRQQRLRNYAFEAALASARRVIFMRGAYVVRSGPGLAEIEEIDGDIPPRVFGIRELDKLVRLPVEADNEKRRRAIAKHFCMEEAQ